jgi:hypothetical protein
LICAAGLNDTDLKQERENGIGDDLRDIDILQSKGHAFVRVGSWGHLNDNTSRQTDGLGVRDNEKIGIVFPWLIDAHLCSLVWSESQHSCRRELHI